MTGSRKRERGGLLSSVAMSSRQMSLAAAAALGQSGKRARNLWHSRPRLFSFLLIPLSHSSPFSTSCLKKNPPTIRLLFSIWRAAKTVLYYRFKDISNLKLFPQKLCNTIYVNKYYIIIYVQYILTHMYKKYTHTYLLYMCLFSCKHTLPHNPNSILHLKLVLFTSDCVPSL